jgi:hypothetical protein
MELFRRVSLISLSIFLTVGLTLLFLVNLSSRIRFSEIGYVVSFSVLLGFCLTIIMIGFEHPNDWIQRVILAFPLVVIFFATVQF